MTAPTSEDYARARAVRRRRLQQRQTVIFGGLVAILLVIGLVAAAMWSGLLPAPFARGFSSDEATEREVVVPCPPAGATPVELASITANVYNGTDEQGLAGSTASTLGQLGVLINQQANWAGGAYDGAVQIVTGSLGVTAAYTLARMFPGSVVALDGTRADETVDVVMGSEHQMLSIDEITALDPAAEIAAPEGCTPVETQDPTAGPSQA